MFREDFAFNCQDVFKHLGHIHVDSPKTLASQFPKVYLHAHLADLTYGWTWNTRYAWEFQRGRHNHPPPHIDARHTQDLFCGCGSDLIFVTDITDYICGENLCGETKTNMRPDVDFLFLIMTELQVRRLGRSWNGAWERSRQSPTSVDSLLPPGGIVS